MGAAHRLLSSNELAEVILWPTDLCSKRPDWMCSIVQPRTGLGLITQVKCYMDQQLFDVQWCPSQDQCITALDPLAAYVSQDFISYQLY